MNEIEEYARACPHPRQWILIFLDDYYWCARCGSFTQTGCTDWLVPGSLEVNRNNNCPRPEEPFVIPEPNA
jgi:hypothetical protein